MTANGKIPPRVLIAFGGICLAIMIIAITILVAGTDTGRNSGIPAAFGTFQAVTPGITGTTLPPPITCTPDVPVREVMQERLGSLDLILTRPPAPDLVPYTGRGFDQPVEAAIAWWMYPGFDEANREFRSYHRATPEKRAAFPQDERIFFDYMTTNLDTAESVSTISSDMTLFRGITPGVAGIVLNSSAWDEAPFASTSYDITVTIGQYASRDAEGYLNVLVIPKRAGEHILFINEDQREFLLPRGTAWDVASVKAVDSLTVNADFPLHNQTERTARFTDVRLISLVERKC